MDTNREQSGRESSHRKFEAGEVIRNRYEIIECLGRGASGVVYSARDLRLAGLKVAIKILPGWFANDYVAQARVALEVRAAHRIEHPNVVRFYSLIQGSDYIALVLEYVDGNRLSDSISGCELLPFTAIVDILKQICMGIREIHARRIVHRDLKPENILFSHEGVIKITDFGIASLTQTPAQQRLDDALTTQSQKEGKRQITATGQVVGTSEFMSPEYIEDGLFDSRADIYALGVILFELITGRSPFEYNSTLELLRLKVTEDCPSPCTFRKDCPAPLEKICLQMLARDPDQRYQSAEQILSDISKLDFQHSAALMYQNTSYSKERKESLWQSFLDRAIYLYQVHVLSFMHMLGLCSRPSFEVSPVPALILVAALIMLVGFFNFSTPILNHMKKRVNEIVAEDPTRPRGYRTFTPGSATTKGENMPEVGQERRFGEDVIVRQGSNNFVVRSSKD